jgi:exopolysaccharide biosynthesis protein
LKIKNGQLYYDKENNETILVLKSAFVDNTYCCLVYNKEYNLDFMILSYEQIVDESILIKDNVDISFYNLLKENVK